jgi:hypothetical protein
MLADHFGVYVLGRSVEALELVGALALPLFSVSLAFALPLRPPVHERQVILRIAVWAGIAEWAARLVRPDGPLTVLATLACGVAVWHFVRHGRSATERVVSVVGALGVSMFAEFGYAGALLVASLLWAARGGGWVAWAGASVWLAWLFPFNASHGALLAIPVVALVSALPRDIPRIRGFFYWAYVGQFPAFALLGVMGGRAWLPLG